MVTVPTPKSAEHERSLPDRPRERSREKDSGDKQRSMSGRTDHNVMSQRDVPRLERAKDGAGASERSRDSRAVPDRQPVKTSAPTVSDVRTKSTSSSSASGQLTTSSQPRSSSSNIPARSDTTASTQPRSSSSSVPARSDTTTEKYVTKVSNLCTYAVSVH